MSLTQERINEIVLEVLKRRGWNDSWHTELTALVNQVISCIREEQEPIAWILPQFTGWSRFTENQEAASKIASIPLFTIPPAAPYNGYKEKYLLLSAQYVRDVEQLESACAELVEALEAISDTDPDAGTGWFHDIANRALSNHAKRMKGEES